MIPPPTSFELEYGHYAIRGHLTVWTHLVINLLTLVWTMPALVLVPLFTFAGGLLVGIPIIGLVFALLYDTLQFLFRLCLVGTGRLWDRVPLLRVPLALVGIPLAVLGYVVTTLTPGTNAQVKYEKAFTAAMCDGWPLSHSIWEIRKGAARLVDEMGRDDPLS
jgi:hypothetical protein